MKMIKSNSNLNDDDTNKAEELYEWLNEFEFSRPKKMMARDFADAIFMAEILKKYHPRMVDLHNYPAANSFGNKLKNWETLNNKVLIPLGLGQSDKFLKDVAAGVKGTVEQLLYIIKYKVDEAKKKEEEEIEQGILYSFTEEVISHEDETFPSTVSLSEFKNMKSLLNKKEEEIASLSGKVKHLEALITLKDQRIEDLITQVNRCTCFKNTLTQWNSDS